MSQLGFKSVASIVDANGNAIPAMTGPTAAVGASLPLAEATVNGTNTITLQAPAALAANRTINPQDATYTLPTGVGNASTLMDLQTAQTPISGNKSFADQTLRIIDQAAGAFRAIFRGPANLTADRAVTLPDAAVAFPAGVGGVSTPMDLQTAQTPVSGNKSFADQALRIIDQAAGAFRAIFRGPANLTADRTITLPDASVGFPPGVAGASTLMDLETAQNIASTKTLIAGGGLNLGAGAGTLGITGGVFMAQGTATTGGAQTVAHGLGRIPTVRLVALDGSDGNACLITLVGADINNVNFTSSAAGSTVAILAM